VAQKKNSKDLKERAKFPALISYYPELTVQRSAPLQYSSKEKFDLKNKSDWAWQLG
jgi:hypothetical protein